MKKSIQTSGISILLLLITGNILKTFHLPGASVLICLSVFIFVLIFAPLMIKKTILSEKKTIDKLIITFGNIIVATFITGVLFKVMHWPYASKLMFGSISLLIFGLIPFYFFMKLKNTNRFETIVNCVYIMIFGGMLYTLFDLSNL